MATKIPPRKPPCIGGEDADLKELSPQEILLLKALQKSWEEYGTRIPLTMQDLNHVLKNPSDSFKAFLVAIGQVNVTINVEKDAKINLGDDRSVNFGGDATNHGSIITGDVETINNNVDASCEEGNTTSASSAEVGDPEEKKTFNKLYAILIALISSGTLTAIIQRCTN